MSSVRFYNADKNIFITNKKQIGDFVSFIFLNENKRLKNLTVISCSDDYLLALNNQFLNHDYYTDVLTFDLSQGNGIVGEIYVSVDRVEENRLLHDASFQNEFCRIIFHGALHLCGYSDKEFNEKVKMTEMEDFYLEKYSSFHVKQI